MADEIAQQWPGTPVENAAPAPAPEQQWPGVPVGVEARETRQQQPSAPQQQGPGVGQTLTQSQEDTERAIRQHVSPFATSKYISANKEPWYVPEGAAKPEDRPKLLGKLEEFEWGQGYRGKNEKTGNTEELRVNPQTDFVARNPETGELAVYTRTPATNENSLTSLGRAVSPYVLSPVTRGINQIFDRATGAPIRPAPVTPAVNPTAVTSATQAARRAADIDRDIEAFDRQGVRKAPIAFTRGPMSGLGQMVANIPFIGDPVRRALDVASEGTRNAAQRLSESLAPSATVEQVGQRLQSGLDRFRTAGVRDVEPGQLSNIGIQPRAPGPYTGQVSVPQGWTPGQPMSPNRVMVAQPDGQVLPLSSYDPQRYMVVPGPASGRYDLFEVAPSHVAQMSGQAAQRAQQAEPIRQQLGGGFAQTSRGVQVPAAQTWGQTIMGRRGAADLSDQELASLVRTPAQDTSFAARSEGLYEQARRAIPSFFRSDTSRNPTRLAAANTRTALGSIDAQIANQIGGQAVIGGELADRLRNTRAHFGLDDLFAMRTEVGRALGSFGQYDQNLSRQQLKQLYGGLSSDIEVGLRDIANRAYINTRAVGNNAPNYVQPAAALQADQSLRSFRTADRYFRQGIANMDRFARVAGTDNPQAAVRMLVGSALDGTKGNLGLLRSAMAALRPEERSQFSALVIDQMGKPLPGVRGVNRELEFSPTSFVTNWNRMDPGARRMLFGGNVARDMDDIVNIATRLSNQEANINTSRSGTHLIHFLTMIGGTAMAMNGHTMLLGAMAGPTAALSFAMSRPGYVSLVARYARLRAAALDTAGGLLSVNPNRGQPQLFARYISQLDAAAQRDPALIPFRNAVAQENGFQDDNQNKNGVRPH